MGQAYAGAWPIGSIDDRNGPAGFEYDRIMLGTQVSVADVSTTSRRTATVTAFAIANALTIVVGSYEWRGLGTSAAPTIAQPSLIGIVGVEGGPASWKHPAFHPLADIPIRVAGTTAGGEHVARQLTADRNGQFRLHLPPGRYHITAIFPGWRDHAQVTVTRGHPVRIA
jgi:hypothetical protein